MTATEAELSKAHMDVATAMRRALDIFTQRNRVHQNLWKQYGALDNVNHAKSKFLRIRQLVERKAPAEEIIAEVNDLVNYAIFIGICVEEGNYGTEDL